MCCLLAAIHGVCARYVDGVIREDTQKMCDDDDDALYTLFCGDDDDDVIGDMRRRRDCELSVKRRKKNI